MPRLCCVVYLLLDMVQNRCTLYWLGLFWFLCLAPLVPKLLHTLQVDSGLYPYQLVSGYKIQTAAEILWSCWHDYCNLCKIFITAPNIWHPPSSTPCLHLILTYIHLSNKTKVKLQHFMLVKVYYWWYLGGRRSPLVMLLVLLSWF